MSLIIDKAKVIREDEEKWKRLIARTVNIEELSEELGVKRGEVGHIFKYLGWNSSVVGEIRRDYSEDPTDKNLRVKWYFYGFVLGDGNLRDDGKTVSIYNTDLDIMQKFSDFLEVPLKYGRKYTEEEIKVGKQGNRQIAYSVTIKNYKLYRDMLEFGMIPCKSKEYCRIGEVPYEYVPDFLRGLMDSDGTVDTRRTKRQQNNIISFLGNPSYMGQIKEIIEQYVPCKLYKVRENLYQVSVIGRQNFVILRDLMYRDTDFYIKRKKDRCYVIDEDSIGLHIGLEAAKARKYWETEFDCDRLKEDTFLFGRVFFLSSVVSRGVEIGSKYENDVLEIKKKLNVGTRVEYTGSRWKFGVKSKELDKLLREEYKEFVDRGFIRGYLKECASFEEERIVLKRGRNDGTYILDLFSRAYGVFIANGSPRCINGKEKVERVREIMEGLI